MRFNFVHGLSADWCCSWLRNGDRCASSEQQAAVCPVFVCCDGDYAAVADVKMRKLWKKTNIKKKKQTVMWS